MTKPLDLSCPHAWIPEESWALWIEHRQGVAQRNKNAPLTGAALKVAVKALTKARLQGYDVGDVLEACVNKGWVGIYVDKGLQPVHNQRPRAVDNVREFTPITAEQRENVRKVRNATALAVKVVKK